MVKRIGHGTVVRVGQGATPTWTVLPGVKDVTMPSFATDDIETTSQDSAGGFKEYIPGLTDLGECSFQMGWDPDSDTDELLNDLRANREMIQLSIQTPGMTAPRIYAAYLKTYSGTAPVNGEMIADVAFRIAGVVTTP